jgi:hypothetical protein
MSSADLKISAGKVCTKCNNHFDILNFYTTGYKVDGTYKYNSWCKSCVSSKMKSYHKKTWGDDKLQFTAFRRTKSIKSYISYLRNKAIQRRSECISIEKLEEIWDNQKGKCALTGWDMTMILGKGNINTNASIDRIDSNKGYIDGNIQFVCRIVNVFKSNATEEVLFNMCESIIKNKKK